MPIFAITILIVWFVIAVVLGLQGTIAALRPPLPQALVLGLTTVLLILLGSWKHFRKWILTIPIDRLVALHLIRFIGIYFIILYSRRQLPFAFAVPGGIGDIIVASAALALLLLPKIGTPSVYGFWNVLGFTDIMMVVVTAARQAMLNPDSMAPLLRLPLSLLPTFFVPLIIFTHVVIGVRLFNHR